MNVLSDQPKNIQSPVIPVHSRRWNQRIFVYLLEKLIRIDQLSNPMDYFVNQLVVWALKQIKFNFEKPLLIVAGKWLIVANIWTTNYSLHIEIFVKWLYAVRIIGCGNDHICANACYYSTIQEIRENSFILFSSQLTISLNCITKKALYKVTKQITAEV